MSLSKYIESAQTDCFKKHGVFFAFSDAQFDKQKTEGVEYASLGAGTICPKANVKAFMIDHEGIVKAGIAKRIEAEGKTAIIRYELANYESWYTGDYSQAAEALEDYGFPIEDIIEQFNIYGGE